MTRFPVSAVLAVSCLAFLTAACAGRPEPGTGDVAFRLRWQGGSDLDLHVADPNGEEINFFRRNVESGGTLDIDCNGGAEAICKKPIENVFWPTEGAPPGVYRFWVELFQTLEDESEVPYVVEVLRGLQVVERHQGGARRDREPEPFSFLYVR